jgi:hypothetical protein
MNTLSRCSLARKNPFHHATLLRSICRNTLENPTQLQSLPSEHNPRTAEKRPALRRLESLQGPQLRNHRHGQREHRTTNSRINYRLLGKLAHALHLESVGVAQHNSFAKGLAFPDGRRTAAVHRLLWLAHSSGFRFSELGRVVQALGLFHGIGISSCTSME